MVSPLENSRFWAEDPPAPRNRPGALVMRKVTLLAIFALGAAGLWWVARLAAPPLPGPPVSSPIATVPPATSAESRGLPTLAPMLRRVMPAVVSITVEARVPAEDNPL